MRRTHGFTLIEVMITVAIIAILASIAIPSYSDYVRRGRITDAVAGLSGMRIKMEQYFQDHRTYAGACVAGTIAPMPDATPSFTFTCPTLGLSTYTATATGTGTMANFVYSINEQNVRTSTVPTGWNNQNCGWVLKKDGSC